MTEPALNVAVGSGRHEHNWRAEIWSWADVAAAVEQPEVRENKDGKLLMWGRLTGTRRRLNTIVEVSQLALDVDEGDVSDMPDRVRRLGVRAAVHSTWSSRPGDAKWRVFAPMDRPLRPNEKRAANAALAARLGGVGYDHTCDSSVQAAFAPSVPSLDGYEHAVTDGPLLDADELVAEGRALLPPPAPAGEVVVPEQLSEHQQLWVIGEVAAALGRIESAPERHRHDRLFDNARLLGGLAAVSPVHDRDDLADQARDAALRAGLPYGEAETTARAGVECGMEAPLQVPLEPADLEGAVFNATTVLAGVRILARERMLSPWGLLGTVLSRVVATTPPQVLLPPLLGDRASLNFGVALVAPSGGNKSATIGASATVLGEELARRWHVTAAGPGSGEGLVSAFLRPDPAYTGKGVAPLVLRSDPAVYLTAPEVSHVGAVQERSGASFQSVTIAALTGDALLTTNASRDRNRAVPRLSYRFAAVVGVQPELSDVLLNAQAVANGQPQRWLWAPTSDAAADPDAEVVLGELHWRHGWASETSLEPVEVAVPAWVRRIVREAAAQRARGETDALDGHALLTRLKVAAAIAALHGERDVTAQWWGLAGSVMKVSDATRRSCLEAIAARRERDNEAQGRSAGVRALAAAAVAEERREGLPQRFAALVRAHADPDTADSNQSHGADAGCTRRCIYRAVRTVGLGREGRLEVAAEAVEDGLVIEHEGRWFPC